MSILNWSVVCLFVILSLLTCSFAAYNNSQLVKASGGVVSDPNLKRVINKKLSNLRPDDQIITAAEMAGLTGTLTANSESINSLSGLEYAVKLTSLNLESNNISDIAPLTSLVNLVNLNLKRNNILDGALPNLSPLTKLVSLNLEYNQISNIKPLKNLTNLARLFLGGNEKIENIKPLEDLTKLTNLNMHNNKISNLEPLENKINLTNLDLGNNEIDSIAPLAGLTNLTVLFLGGNKKISSVEPLKNLTKLTKLHLYNNKISNIAPLKGLTSLTELNLNINKISNIDSLKTLTELTTLYLGRNQISSVEPLKNLTKLTKLHLYVNRISNIEPLKGLINLTNLDLNSNKIANLAPLATLSKLTDFLSRDNKPTQEVTTRIFDNPLKDIQGNAVPITETLHVKNIPGGKIEVLSTIAGGSAVKVKFSKNITYGNNKKTTFSNELTIKLNFQDPQTLLYGFKKDDNSLGDAKVEFPLATASSRCQTTTYNLPKFKLINTTTNTQKVSFNLSIPEGPNKNGQWTNEDIPANTFSFNQPIDETECNNPTKSPSQSGQLSVLSSGGSITSTPLDTTAPIVGLPVGTIQPTNSCVLSDDFIGSGISFTTANTASADGIGTFNITTNKTPCGIELTNLQLKNRIPAFAKAGTHTLEITLTGVVY